MSASRLINSKVKKIIKINKKLKDILIIYQSGNLRLSHSGQLVNSCILYSTYCSIANGSVCWLQFEFEFI